MFQTPYVPSSNGRKPGALITCVPFRDSPDGTYQYSPLQEQEIRLIKIYSCPSPCSPGQQLHHMSHKRNPRPPPRYDDGEMHISIQHSPISNCYHDFTALSYCWGDPHDRRIVFVHELGGEDEVQVMSVTASLYGALQRAQYATIYGLNVNEQTSISGLFWADAICIRQEWDKDDEDEDLFWAAEKADQVKMMAQIYESAITCLIDLGHDSFDSHLVHDFMLVLMRALNKAGKEGRLDRAEALKPFELAQYGLPSLEHPRWSAWTNFLARPWFRRVWVVQEYCLSNPGGFMFGSRGESFPWNTFPLYARNLHFLGLNVSSRRHSKTVSESKIQDAAKSEGSLCNHAIFATKKEHGRRPTLLDGLKNGAPLEATDLRDKAYSLLGMCAPLNHGDPDLRVEYFNNVPPEQVLLRFTRYVLRTVPNPTEVLYACDGSYPALPSWFPNWMNPQQSPLKQFRNTTQIYRAGGQYQDSLRLHGANDTVVCEGLAFDKVLHVGIPYVGSEYVFLDWEKQSRTWLMKLYHNPFQQNISLRKLHPTSNDMEDAYARTLFGDNPPDVIGTQRYSLFQKVTEIFNTARRGVDQEVGVPITTLFDDVASFETWDTTWRACLIHCHRLLRGRRLCVTRDGRLAIVPALARVGDQLLILKGAVTPFAMRGANRPLMDPSDTKILQLLGGCYVDGVMYGEVLKAIGGINQWSEILIH